MKLFNASSNNRFRAEDWPLGDLSIVEQIIQPEVYTSPWGRGDIHLGKINDQAKKAAGKMATLDLEWWPLSNVWSDVSDAALESIYDEYKIIIRALRGASGHSIRLGMYNVFPVDGRIVGKRESDIRRSIGRMMVGRNERGQWESSGLIDCLDVMMPSGYIRFDAATDDVVARLKSTIDYNRMAGKPIYVFVWQRYHDAHDNQDLALRYIGDDNLRATLDTIGAMGCHAMLWDYTLDGVGGGLANGAPDPMTPADYESFYRVIEDYK